MLKLHFVPLEKPLRKIFCEPKKLRKSFQVQLGEEERNPQLFKEPLRNTEGEKIVVCLLIKLI